MGYERPKYLAPGVRRLFVGFSKGQQTGKMRYGKGLPHIVLPKLGSARLRLSLVTGANFSAQLGSQSQL